MDINPFLMDDGPSSLESQSNMTRLVEMKRRQIHYDLKPLEARLVVGLCWDEGHKRDIKHSDNAEQQKYQEHRVEEGCSETSRNMGSETIVDFFPFFRILNDGTIQRFMGTDTLPPQNSGVPVASHDITLDATKGVYVRVYVPITTFQLGEKLPVVVYIHGGGFCIESAASPTYHNYLNLLATEAKVICVSVDYRRVPEHRLPVPYKDCFSALEWLDSETLIPCIANKADFGRCFVAGDSAGGNIVHQLGIMASQKSWKRLCIEGAVFVHPFFDGEDKIDVELGPESQAMLDFGDGLWKLSLPDGADKDHPFSNPIAPNSPALSSLLYRRLLIVVAGKDFLKHRAKLYYEALRKAGKEAEFMNAEEEMHVFHLMDLQCPNAVTMMKRISDFIAASTPPPTS